MAEGVILLRMVQRVLTVTRGSCIASSYGQAMLLSPQLSRKIVALCSERRRICFIDKCGIVNE